MAGSRVNHYLYLGVLALWSFGGLSASLRPSGLVWSGSDDRVWVTWRPPSFMEKLLSGKWDQGDWEFGVSLWPSLCGKSRGPWKRVDGWEVILLIECFNNMH